MYLNDLNESELDELVVSLGMKKFRGDQIFRAINNRHIKSVDELKQLSLDERHALNEIASIRKMSILEVFQSKLDETKKLLYLLHDNNIIEGVLMKYKHGYSLCISTQVGCKMGCSFCASTKGGLVRNLEVSEITSQLYLVEDEFGIKISNVVLMGSGEPLDNYENVIKSLRILNSEKGRNLSLRSFTLSTCGIPENIIRLASENIPIGLAISLHSLKDEVRSSMMPINKRYDIESVLKAVHYYQKKTNDRISFEYTVIPGANDSDDDVKLLRNKLKSLNCIINLIALNPILEYNMLRFSNNEVQKFMSKLEEAGLNVTLRRELGSDISASCGQLKKSYLEDGVANEI